MAVAYFAQSAEQDALRNNKNKQQGHEEELFYTLTAGLFGIGCLVDFIKILCGKFTDKDGNLIQREKK